MLGPFLLLTRTQLWVSVAAALFFAIPGMTLFMAMVVFPVVFFAAIAIVTGYWPILIAIGYALFGLSPWVTRLVQAWQMCTIMWIGSAVGVSTWGYAGSAIGAKSTPFLTALLAPWSIPIGYLLG